MYFKVYFDRIDQTSNMGKNSLVSSTPKAKQRRSSSVSSLDLDASDHIPGTSDNKIRQPRKVKKSSDVVHTKQTTLDIGAWKNDNTLNNDPIPVTSEAQSDNKTETDRKLDMLLSQMAIVTSQLKDVVKVDYLDKRLEQVALNMKEETEKMHSEMFDLRNENDSLKKRVALLEKRVTENYESIGLSHLKVDMTKDNLDDLEQHGRLSTVRIYGIDDKNKYEDVNTSTDLALQLFNEKLGMDIDDSEISIAHRLGRWNPQQPRGIIVKFVRRSIKMEVMKSRSKIQNTKFSIKEDVTNTNRALMEKLRMREDTNSVWSSNGKVFAEMSNSKVRKFESDLKTRITNHQKVLSNSAASEVKLPGNKNTIGFAPNQLMSWARMPMNLTPPFNNFPPRMRFEGPRQ